MRLRGGNWTGGFGDVGVWGVLVGEEGSDIGSSSVCSRDRSGYVIYEYSAIDLYW